MMLLAIDTSTRSVGIALYDGIQVVSELIWFSQQYQTVELAPKVSTLLDQAEISVGDIRILAVAKGPGSYTGLRIGLSFAKGMALAGHLAIVGIPTLDILSASQAPNELPLVAVLQAGRGRLAVGRYAFAAGKWQSNGQARIMPVKELAATIKSPTLVCGELTEEERNILKRKRINVILASPAQCVRRPSFLAEIAWQRWQKGLTDDPAILAPDYLQFENRSSG
jgi:tRNA threonylcarbamoyladenosine biosynthesis protein TsaB